MFECYVKSDIIKTEEEIKEELQIILNDLINNCDNKINKWILI